MESAGTPCSGAGRIASTVVDSARGPAGRSGVLHQESLKGSDGVLPAVASASRARLWGARRRHHKPPERQPYVLDAFSSGRLKENTDPLPNWLTTPIVPPCASTITFAIARPMPVPGAV